MPVEKIPLHVIQTYNIACDQAHWPGHVLVEPINMLGDVLSIERRKGSITKECLRHNEQSQVFSDMCRKSSHSEPLATTSPNGAEAPCLTEADDTCETGCHVP